MAEKTLVIVESAAKARTLNKFLGRNYKVKASVGHIRDLPKSKLGIDVENDFEPQYITIRGKGELVREIKAEAAKADRVLLATDPDREGEAIAWHLQKALRLPEDDKCRIEFHEITKEAVKQAIKEVRPVDMDRVDAQQARRVLDRLVGYNLSPLLWAKVRKGLSAGRVQSVALRMICDREREIRDFVPEEYWLVDAQLSASGQPKFMARLVSYKDEKYTVRNEAEMQKVERELQGSRILVKSVEKKTKTKKSAPPFITSTLQQEASRRMNFFSKRTMRVAQELYEGLELGKGGSVGLITYLRTDSTRVAASAQSEALDFITQTYGREYAPSTPNVFKSRKSAQDAHEAIRPTSVQRTPDSVKEYLSKDQFRLYKLIWERFVASQMSMAVYDTVTVEIAAGDYGLRSSSSALVFPGYKKVYNDNEEEEAKNPIPELKSGEELKLLAIDREQRFTQPPPRYTEASIVKMMEESNIGRPSTYAPIIDTLLKRNYMERQSKQFVPTELGFVVVDLLADSFRNIMEVDFTAQMEENLDQVEEGRQQWKQPIRDFYGAFADDLSKANAMIEKIEIKDEEAGKDCPECGKPLLVRHGRFGRFIACSGFPQCRYTESINEEVGVNCPLCGKSILALKSKKGRRYYGCSGYPECTFRAWDQPTGELCPDCGGALVEKTTKNKAPYIRCSNAECKYVAAKAESSGD